MPHYLSQMFATPLVTEPTRYADVQIKIEVRHGLLKCARKTMHHTSANLVAMLAHDANKVIVCISLMQKQWQPIFSGQLQMRNQTACLIIAR